MAILLFIFTFLFLLLLPILFLFLSLLLILSYSSSVPGSPVLPAHRNFILVHTRNPLKRIVLLAAPRVFSSRRTKSSLSTDGWFPFKSSRPWKASGVSRIGRYRRGRTFVR